MTQDEVFIQAVLAAPDDDTPRLVYADFLEEHGEPERAEFIRVQCQLAHLPQGDSQRAELEARERVLLAEHEADWLGPLASPLLHWRFRRGFVASLGHAGFFQSTDSVEDDEGYRLWTYIRFYADGLGSSVSREFQRR
jgi:uncharacterized protein (TIGR02996 family)